MSEMPSAENGLLPGTVEYHRHDSGDVVQGRAERCIDPDAGAHDVVVLTPEEVRERMAQAWSEGAEGQRRGFATMRFPENPYRVFPPATAAPREDA